VRCTRLLLLVGLLCLAACGNKDSGGNADPAPKQTDNGKKLAGVYPEDFKCSSILTDEAVGQILGGTARNIEGQFAPPRGVPRPCNYEVTTQTTEYWMFDIDCRDHMKERADGLFKQYAEDSADKVNDWNRLSDAGIKPSDAGVAVRPPEPAVEVQVGAKALDHHGRGLIFIDDDAPCYVRVVGPDAARRLELAKQVAKNLTFANAPMTPRPMQ
jgi:hypothetical protein